ncbi:RluA family pseudouridine synthase [Sphingomonas sp. S2-65]|uniref:RluA family pseudouridine synthase n=1 Tax=Sphingomonas sp. S2-65 TaxID=2903960 RepID=UPI001F1E238C|nr:RluA family pseudouridine synthase [Sphingomonas sp. S2-65]UYY58283.1 RluA family pseudouridine synthase [Sphingomonas sp. S2-65]
MSNDVRQFTVAPDDDGIRLDRWFKRHMEDVSFNIVSRWARTGQLRVDGARATPADRLAAGQVLRLPPAEAPKPASTPRPKRDRPALSAEQTELAESMVIHKDASAIVLNKPPGLATQGGTKTFEHVDGLLDALQYEAEGRPKLVHRLDKDTSGALLVARSAKAAAFFSKSFSGRTAKKIYWALVVGVPDIADGFIDLPIGKQPGTGGEKMQVDEKEGQAARTRYRMIERAGNTGAWVELQPFTGRTHQLRVHMAAIGHPIVGDGKYGGPEAFLTGGVSRKMHLHSRRLRIDHPDGEKIDITAELPSHFAESMKTLGFDLALGEMTAFEDRPPLSRDELKSQARAHAKTVRKERRGERRGRAESNSARAETARSGKPSAKPRAPAGRAAEGPRAGGSGARTGAPGPRTGGAGPRTGGPAGRSGGTGPRTGGPAGGSRGSGPRTGGGGSGGGSGPRGGGGRGGR